MSPVDALRQLAAEFDKRWADNRAACLSEDDPQWKAISAGMARAYDDARQEVERLLALTGGA